MIDAGPTQEMTPPCSDVQNSPLLKEREGAAGEQLRSHSPEPLHLPLSKDSIVPSSLRRESELKRVMKPAGGAEAGEVGVGLLPKTTRRRGSQTQSISVRLTACCWSLASA